MANKMLTEADFVQRVKFAWGDHLDVVPGTYRGSCMPVRLICPIHGEFEYPTASAVYNGEKPQGCPKCSQWQTRFRKRQEFIGRAHKVQYRRSYGFSMVDFVDYRTPVQIWCVKHGYFYRTPDEFLHGKMCPGCLKQDFQSRILAAMEHNNLNQVLPSILETCENVGISKEYINSFVNNPGDTIIDENEAQPSDYDIIRDFSRRSIGEELVKQYCDTHNIDYMEQFKIVSDKFRNRHHMYVDFYCPQHKVYIEYNGPQHYERSKLYHQVWTLEDQKIRDADLAAYCEKQGCSLLTIHHRNVAQIEQILDKFFAEHPKQ